MSGPIFVVDSLFASASNPTALVSGSGSVESLRDGSLGTSYGIGPSVGAGVRWYKGFAPAFIALHGLRGAVNGVLVYEIASSSTFTDALEVARFSPAADQDGYRPDVWASIEGAPVRPYHRLRVVDAGSEADHFWLGQLVVADATRVRQLSRMYRWGYTESEAWARTTHETAAGEAWSYLLNPTPRRSWSLSWGGLTQAQRDEVQGVVRASQGGHLPVTFVPDPDGDTAYYVRGQQSVGGPVAFTGNYTIPTLVLRELAREVA